MDQNQKLSLIIKTPNRDQEDQTVDRVPPDWTVWDLKTHLSDVHAARPAVSDQLLIHGGKLLPDHLTMKELFRQTDSVLSLHLVCSFRNPPSRPKVATADRPGSHDMTAPEARQRRRCPPLAGSGPPAVSPPPLPAFPTYSLYSAQQLLWLQQVYARQFYMQYHAALAAAASVPPRPTSTAAGPHLPVPAHQVPVPAPLANRNPADNLPVDENPVPDGALVNVDQNLRMNAQGGPLMEDEDGADRDWLDWVYSAARLGVLLTIVYFNSSLSRFLLVMSTLLLLVLHTAGWFPFRRRVQVPEADQFQNQNQDGVQEDGPGDPGDSMTAVLVPPHRVSLMWTAWVFFKTFFSSLIPEVPQGVAN
ncbi:unnamed protein product [Ophioblennius macclurei]